MRTDYCLDCGAFTDVIARNLCRSCYQRHRKAGTLGRYDKKQKGMILKTVDRGVYRFVWNPTHPLAHKDGYVSEHRMVLWDAGILTDLTYHVHHINGDQLDNRLENLEAISPGEHRRIHSNSEGTKNQFGWSPPRPTVCDIDGCDLPVKSRRWCCKHYTRWLRSGDPLGHSRGSHRKKF